MKAAATAEVTANPAKALRKAPPLAPGCRAATRWAERTTTVRMVAPTPSRNPAKDSLGLRQGQEFSLERLAGTPEQGLDRPDLDALVIRDLLVCPAGVLT